MSQSARLGGSESRSVHPGPFRLLLDLSRRQAGLAHRSNSMQYWSVPEAPGPLAAATLRPDPAGPGNPGSRRTRAHRPRGGRRQHRLVTPSRRGPHAEPSVEAAITQTSGALRPCAVGARPRHTPGRSTRTLLSGGKTVSRRSSEESQVSLWSSASGTPSRFSVLVSGRHHLNPPILPASSPPFQVLLRIYLAR